MNVPLVNFTTNASIILAALLNNKAWSDESDDTIISDAVLFASKLINKCEEHINDTSCSVTEEELKQVIKEIFAYYHHKSLPANLLIDSLKGYASTRSDATVLIQKAEALDYIIPIKQPGRAATVFYELDKSLDDRKVAKPRTPTPQ